jgi:hypothetical protein
MKRKFSVRGVAGTTPVASRTITDLSHRTVAETPGPSRMLSTSAAASTRRQSSAHFVTPAVSSRTLGSSKTLGRSATSTSLAEGRRRSSALGDSSRHNSMVTPSLAPKVMISDAALKARQSVSVTSPKEDPQVQSSVAENDEDMPRTRTRSRREMVPA